MTRLKIPIIIAFTLLLVTMTVAFQVSDSQTISYSSTDDVVLKDEQAEYPLGLYMDILEDPSGKLTIEDVSSPAYAALFKRSQKETPIYGFTDSVYWVRLNLHNETRMSRDWLMEVFFANMHFVDLYTPLPGGEGFTVQQSGAMRPYSPGDLRYPRSVFPLSIPTESQETIYLRFQTGTSMTLGLTLWTQKAFFNHAVVDQVAFGLFFGILIGLFFYNLFLLVSLREVNYLYFVVLLASLVLEEATYNGYLKLFSISSVYLFKPYYYPAAFALTLVSMLLFADSFLELKKRLREYHLANLVGVVGFSLLILLIPIVSYRHISTIMLFWSFPSLLVILIAGVISWKWSNRPTRLLMLAWLCLVVFIYAILLVRLGSVSSTFSREGGYRLGSMAVAILFSIALADRINMLQAETKEANQKLLKNEHRLSQILDGMPLGVVLYTNDHKPQYANRSTTEILSHPEMDIHPDISMGRTIAQAIEYFSFKMTGSHLPYPLENFPVYSALKGQPAYVDDVEMHVGDKIIPLEIWASPIKSETGEVESAVAIFEDITLRRQTEAELAQYRKLLESLVEQRTAEVNAANKELRLRLEWLAAVNLVNQMIAHSVEFAQIHERIVEIVNHVFSVRNSFIAEIDKETGQLRILAHSGSNIHPELVGSSIPIPGDLRTDASTEPGKAVTISSDIFDDPYRPMTVHVHESEVQNIAFVPLQVRDQVLGFLGLEFHEKDRSITSEESNLLSIFSTDIAQLIEDARLFEQAKMLVAAEERNRLARELHDSVAQTLYSISLFIDATRLAMKTNKPKVVESHLEELTQLSREAMSDMRLLIFELRPPILAKRGLAAALQSRLESVEAKAGFEASFETDGSIHLSPAQESELYRIAQEALNNVIKHAQANRVVIRLVGESDCVCMTIEDDGVGFDPDTIEQGGGQGFRNMRERAANIGGRCLIESVPGQGTKITIEVNE